jgi:acetylornithine deacetylase/succinyl-diaminopimelate desuccinylase-like protein
VTAVDEATELLQTLIRNRCVNDGTPDSGGEVRNADTLSAYLEGSGVGLMRYEPHPGRVSLVARLEGTGSRSLLYMGHTDVVPADPNGWTRDPFGGELAGGEIWGRGASDMLCMTTTMAVAFKRLAASGFRPKGTLVYLGVADEESLGTYGAEWLTANAWDDVRADACLTESGGTQLPLPSTGGPKALIRVAERGSHWITLRVKGTPGHGSQPYHADNALAKAAEVVRRIVAYRAPLRLDGLWRASIEAMQLSPDLTTSLLDADRFYATIDELPRAIAKMFDASVHTTFSPNVLHSGSKTNIIPDSALLEVDIRTAPGDADRVREMLREAIGDLWEHVEVVDENPDPPSSSRTDNPVFPALSEVVKKVTGATVVPAMALGATDNRFFRRKGVPSYGYSVYSDRIPYSERSSMVHGRNERMDQESLRLMLDLYEQTARAYLG